MLASSPLPIALLILLGFVVGAAGHLYKSPVTIATGIGLILLAVVLAQIGVELEE